VASLRGTPYDTGLDLEVLSVAARRFRTVLDRHTEAERASSPVDSRMFLHRIPAEMLSAMARRLGDSGATDKLDDALSEAVRIRADLGHPPLVPPVSGIVADQAVRNVICGKRYAEVTPEIRDLVKGLFGRLNAPVDEELNRKVLGGEKAFTGRPADRLEPGLSKAAKDGGVDKTEDVLCASLFPEDAARYFEFRERGSTPEEEVAAVLGAILARSIHVVPPPAPAPKGPRGNLWAMRGRVEAMRRNDRK
jgi:pyruvate/oxaloacetate carboxyltransferase